MWTFSKEVRATDFMGCYFMRKNRIKSGFWTSVMFLTKEGYSNIEVQKNHEFLPKLSVTRYLSEKRLLESLRLAEENIFDAYHEFSGRVVTTGGRDFVYECVLNKQQNLCLELEAYSSVSIAG